MALPAPFNPDAIDLPSGAHSATLTLDAPSILAGEQTAGPTLNLGDTVLLQGQATAPHIETHHDSFDPGFVGRDVITTNTQPLAPHITIVPTFDASVTNDAAIATNYESAVNSAISFFEANITTQITVDINFGWGEVGGTTIDAGALGESSSANLNFTYSQVYNAVTSLANQSTVQQTAYATLPHTAPTGVTNLDVTTAQAAALGLQSNTGNGGDGSVGLDSSSTFFWSQPSPQGSAYDAVSTFEHEISEVLGRSDNGGVGGSYTLLDFFRYTAQGDNTAAAAGTPVGTPGTPDQPFASGYSANNQAYFSWNGQTVTLVYDTPTAIAGGADIADWGPSVPTDSFGYGIAGQVAPVSPTDLQEMNVLGYGLAAACYAEGTRVLTANGPVAVEDLAVGMEVATVSGRLARIAWTGRRTVEPARHPEPHTMNPIRVRAGAFGTAPTADLLLSPDHAVLIEGRLVPIRHLANGTSIAQEPRARITYWHLELDRHDAILAEGLACETYLDTGNRDAFEGSGPTQLHPDFRQHHAQAIWAEHGCAPILTDPADRALRRLHTQALARAA